MTNKTKELLLNHYNTYPLLQIRDIFKYLHQSTFGCEHMVSDEEKAVSYIKSEYENCRNTNKAKTEILDGDFCRVHLSHLSDGLCAETLGRLFYMSGQEKTGSLSALQDKLTVARNLICENALPFSSEDFDKELDDWKNNGFPAIHHSDVFRKAYNPAYRVISNKYIPFLPLFAKIDSMKDKTVARIAIEGGSASGKTTLSKILETLYDCNMFHMDDFFLRPEQRTKERFSLIGGNIDKERFLSEVLLPLSKNEPFAYRKFDCSSMSLGDIVNVTPKKLNITEGAYSMHPELAEYYDFSVFLEITPTLQKKRILNRNTPDMAKRFFDSWIPLENRYFDGTDIKKRCNMTINITE